MLRDVIYYWCLKISDWYKLVCNCLSISNIFINVIVFIILIVLVDVLLWFVIKFVYIIGVRNIFIVWFFCLV